MADNSSWTCYRCTYLNPASKRRCEMCASRKGLTIVEKSGNDNNKNNDQVMEGTPTPGGRDGPAVSSSPSVTNARRKRKRGATHASMDASNTTSTPSPSRRRRCRPNARGRPSSNDLVHEQDETTPISAIQTYLCRSTRSSKRKQPDDSSSPTKTTSSPPISLSSSSHLPSHPSEHQPDQQPQGQQQQPFDASTHVEASEPVHDPGVDTVNMIGTVGTTTGGDAVIMAPPMPKNEDRGSATYTASAHRRHRHREGDMEDTTAIIGTDNEFQYSHQAKMETDTKTTPFTMLAEQPASTAPTTTTLLLGQKSAESNTESEKGNGVQYKTTSSPTRSEMDPDLAYETALENDDDGSPSKALPNDDDEEEEEDMTAMFTPTVASSLPEHDVDDENTGQDGQVAVENVMDVKKNRVVSSMAVVAQKAAVEEQQDQENLNASESVHVTINFSAEAPSCGMTKGEPQHPSNFATTTTQSSAQLPHVQQDASQIMLVKMYNDPTVQEMAPEPPPSHSEENGNDNHNSATLADEHSSSEDKAHCENNYYNNNNISKNEPPTANRDDDDLYSATTAAFTPTACDDNDLETMTPPLLPRKSQTCNLLHNEDAPESSALLNARGDNGTPTSDGDADSTCFGFNYTPPTQSSQLSQDDDGASSQPPQRPLHPHPSSFETRESNESAHKEHVQELDLRLKEHEQQPQIWQNPEQLGQPRDEKADSHEVPTDEPPETMRREPKRPDNVSVGTAAGSSNTGIRNGTGNRRNPIPSTSRSAKALFRTAGSNLAITATEENMERASRLMLETSAPEDDESAGKRVKPNAPKRPAVSTSFATAGSGTSIAVSKESIDRANRLLDEATLTTENLAAPEGELHAPIVFRSAGSSRPLHVSEESIQRAERSLGSIDVLDEGLETTTTGKWLAQPPLAVSQTAGLNRTLEVSEESLSRANRWLNTGSEQQVNPRPLVPLQKSFVAAFQTAGSSRTIQVSKEALSRARRLLHSNVEEIAQTKPSFQAASFQKTGSKTHMSVLEMSTSLDNRLLGSMAKEKQIQSASPSCWAASFQTAGSGAVISVSKESLDRANRLLEEPKVPASMTASIQRIGMTTTIGGSKESMRDTGKSPTAMRMFQTAGTGKPVEISKESLQRAELLLDEGYENSKGKLGPSSALSLVMFQTAGLKKPVNVSTDALRRAEQLFDGRDEKVNAANVLTTPMFQTAGSRKLVEVSNESLKRAEQLLMVQPDANEKPAIFQTAGSKRCILVSEESLGRATQLLAENRKVGPCRQSLSQPTMPAFKTAGFGSTVKVSKDDLKKAALLMEQHSKYAPSNANFRLDKSNREIAVAEENLKEASRLLDDTSNERHCPQVAATLFQTAGSGQLVSVSEESLAFASRILQHNQGKASQKVVDTADPLEGSLKDNVPATPSDTAVASPHRQLVRFGSIRRVACGVTPAPSKVTNQRTMKQNDDCCDGVANANEASLAGKASFDPRNVQSTPRDISLMSRSAYVTLPTGEGGVLRKRQPENEGKMTPVSIDFNNDSEMPQSSPHKLLPEESIAEECTSLLDAMMQGEMTTCPNKCRDDGVTDTTMSTNAQNAAQVRFHKSSGLPACFITNPDDTDLLGGLGDIRDALIEKGCDDKSLKDAWIANHSRWIIWKLASSERRFSRFLGGKYLTYQNLIHQLVIRYNKEITEGLRPAIRKILNRDIAASKLMVLVVCHDIISNQNGTEPQKPALRRLIEVSDGWYSVKASLDSTLSGYLDDGLIKPGTKLLVSNASLMGGDDGIDPLDQGDGTNCANCLVTLQLTANSTRLAKWDAKLGFVKTTNGEYSQNGLLVVKRISDIKPRGGQVPVIRLLVQRVYPMMFRETIEEDQSDPESANKTNHTLLTEQEEDSRKRQFDKRKSLMIEKVTESVQAEIEKEVDENAPEVWKKMIQSASPEDIKDSFSADDKEAIERWREKRGFLVEKRVRQEIESELETESSMVRKSTPFVRVKVQSIQPSNKMESALLTIWNPTEVQRSMMTEGATVQAFHLGVRETSSDGLLHLSANGRTNVESYSSETASLAKQIGYQPRRLLSLFHVHKLSQIANIQSKGRKRHHAVDFDVAGVQIHVVEPRETDEDYCIYLTDESRLVLRIHCKKMPNSLMEGSQACFSAFAMCDLRILPFDDRHQCAVAEYGQLSSVMNSKKRIDELETWAASLGVQDQLLIRVAAHAKAQLPMWNQCRETKVAIGYVVHTSASETEKKLYVTVDCCGAGSHVLELPPTLLQEMISVIQVGGQKVHFTCNEEAIMPSFGCLEAILRCRGFLWRFHIKAKAGSSRSEYIIEKAGRVDKIALGHVLDSW